MEKELVLLILKGFDELSSRYQKAYLQDLSQKIGLEVRLPIVVAILRKSFFAHMDTHNGSDHP
jgi:hypothetical protein